MRLLIDIGHPAHVHLFKNVAKNLLSRGHDVLFSCRDREHVLQLLAINGFQAANFGKHYSRLSGKIYGLVKNEIQMLSISRNFKPDMYLSHGSTIAAVASFIMRKPHIALEDTFNMEQVKLSMLFTDVVLTGDYLHPALGKKEIKYPGYHELAYLHPHQYKPDPKILDTLGVRSDEKYAVVRFIAWKATHDAGHKGMSYENKLELIHNLSQVLKVFVSSENQLIQELEPYKLNIPPAQIHDALYYAHLFIGESATMASESAVLGTPAIFIHSSRFGSTDDQASYGLLAQFSESELDQKHAIKQALLFARDNELKSITAEKRFRMLSNKIDVTSFLSWFIETYPRSAAQARQPCFDFARFNQ